jgi:hypothetical protein
MRIVLHFLHAVAILAILALIWAHTPLNPHLARLNEEIARLQELVLRGRYLAATEPKVRTDIEAILIRCDALEMVISVERALQLYYDDPGHPCIDQARANVVPPSLSGIWHRVVPPGSRYDEQ